MAVRVANWIAIAVGGTGGTLAALMGSASAPPPVTVPDMPLRPVNEIAAQVQAAAPALSAEPALSAAAIESLASADSATPSTSAPPSAASAAPATSAAPAAPATSADTAELPSTPESLLHAEMHCDQGKSESCIIAARSYESGSAGQTDPEKAEKYRRIALRQPPCEERANWAAALELLARLAKTRYLNRSMA